jgi:GT2 family glycosyltransferase
LFAPRELPPLRPDAAHDLEAYRSWVGRREEERLAGGGAEAMQSLGRSAPPIVLVVVPSAADRAELGRTLSSLGAQTRSDFELSVAVEGGDGPWLGQALAAFGPRARHVDVPAGTSRETALAQALAAVPSSGAANDGGVLVVSAGDELAPDALELLAARLNESGAPLVYADEDTVDACGDRLGPLLKPAWSPDLLLSTPYLGRAVLMRRAALIDAGGFAPLEGGDAWHDLLLRLTDGVSDVAHIAEVLSHRRAEPLTENEAAGPAAVTRALERRGEPANVAPSPVAGAWSVARSVSPDVRVSVIVPFRDGATLLRACCDTVAATASGVDLELVLVDNGSCDPETISLVTRLSESPNVKVLRDDRAFNWAALNNAATALSTGDVLVFLNNDIECRRDGWLADMAAQALRPDVGAVGARLLYPDGRVQHAGVVLGMGGAAGHVLAGLPGTEAGYLGMAVLTRDCCAVTGACLATRRQLFDDLGGFDESLGLDLNDIDYCMRVRRHGLRVVYEPRAELVHYESPSRGTSGSVPDIERFIDRWEQEILDGDPHLSPNLTRVDCSCALRGLDEKGWWQEWRSSLRTS